MRSLIFCLVVVSSMGWVSCVEAHTVNPKVIEAVTGYVIEEDVHQDTVHREEKNEGDPRGHDRTFYSFPEWYIVYSAQEYGEFIMTGARPSQFSFFTAIGQEWQSWRESELLAEAPPDDTTSTILWTIALSFSLEYGVIGLYESTVGAMSERWHFFQKTTEDHYIDEQAVAYGEFLNQTPWYEFPYFNTLAGLWTTYGWSSVTPRGIERRLAYTLGYGLKGVYAAVIRALSQANFGGATAVTTVIVEATAEEIAPWLEVAIPVSGAANHYQINLPRYRAFLPEALALAEAGARFVSIQGHDTVALSVVASNQACLAAEPTIRYKLPIQSTEDTIRYVLSTSMEDLPAVFERIAACDLSVEHIYDY